MVILQNLRFPDLKRQAVRFLFSNDGATAIEYALIAGSIAVAIVLIVNTLGTTTQGMFQRVEDGLNP